MAVLLLIQKNEILKQIIESLHELSCQVETCANSIEFLEKLGTQQYSHLICEMEASDPENPFDGFDLGRQAQKISPNVQIALIGNTPIDECIHIASRYHMSYIINWSELLTHQDKILTLKNFLGLMHLELNDFLNHETKCQQEYVTNPDGIDQTAQKLAHQYGNTCGERKIRTVLNELITNALFYGCRHEESDDKTTWEKHFELPQEHGVLVSHGEDDEKVAISIKDPGGKLKTSQILYWLSRQIPPKAGLMPEGLLDSHGRGIYLSWKHMDRFVACIHPDQSSEIFIVKYHHFDFNHLKSLELFSF